MNLLKLSLLSTVFIATISICSAQAKQKKTLEQKSIEMTTKLKKELKLTNAQTEKITPIYLAYLKEKKVLEDKISALKKERNTKINEILTDDQKKKNDALKKKKKKK